MGLFFGKIWYKIGSDFSSLSGTHINEPFILYLAYTSRAYSVISVVSAPDCRAPTLKKLAVKPKRGYEEP